MFLRCNPDLSIRRIEGELFIYDRNRALIHTFNETGTLIWDAFERNCTPEEVLKLIMDTYAVDEGTAAADIGSFVEECGSRGLMTEVCP